MTKPALILKDIAIFKMPGFPRGLDEYRDLVPGINIISGANASGKTSTARAIQQLLWPKAGGQLQARASAIAGQDTWELTLDSENRRVQKNGLDQALTGLPPAEAAERYLLALDELLQKEEQDLARYILRETLGGYDLDLAGKRLNYSGKIKNKTVNEARQAEESEREFSHLASKQLGLKDKEQQLTRLKEDLEHSRQAGQKRDLYALAEDFLQTRLECDQAEKACANYPQALKLLFGQELDQVRQLEEEIQGAKTEIDQAQGQIEKDRQEINALDLPQSGLDSRTLDELDSRIEALLDIEREIQEQDQFHKTLRGKSEQALSDLGLDLDPGTWPGIEIPDLDRLEQFWHQAHQNACEQQLLEAKSRGLANEIQGLDSTGPDQIAQGITSLGYWLQSGPIDTGIPRWRLLAVALTGLAGALAASFAGKAGLLAGIGALAVATPLAWAFKPGNKQAEIRQQDFAKTELTPPKAWEVQEVVNRLDELLTELKTAEHRRHCQQRLVEVHKELEALQARTKALQAEKAEWQGRLGAIPELPEQDLKGQGSLYLFLTNLNNWQGISREQSGAQSKLEALHLERDKLLDTVNQLLLDCRAQEASDGQGAKAVQKALKSAEARRRELDQDLAAQERTLTDKQGVEKKAQKRLAAIYARLGLAPEDREQLRDLVQQLPEYQEARDRWRFCQTDLEKKEALLRDHSLYPGHKTEIDSLSLDLARQYKGHYTSEAEKWTGIQTKIARIESELDQAKRSRELEEALAQKDKALDGLEGLYQENLSSITGDLLLTGLKEENWRENQPQVFRRADQLFSQITAGRHELRLQGQDHPNFMGYDHLLRLGQGLDTLSAATRVQLLLAVRLAYIEAQESYFRLPIIADELLANSDDTRAQAVIGALIELCRQGRQIFYLTAQGDEVAKWQDHLKAEPELESRFIELSNQGQEQAARAPIFSRLKLEKESPPDYQGLDHEAYGRKLQVPAFDLLNDKVSQLHLWYLVDDPGLLFVCLKKGIRHFGPLDNYFQHQGRLSGCDPELIDRLRAKVRALEHFQYLYKMGRSRPIDREVLRSSKAVSDRFIDRVAEKLSELNADPEALIQALEAGEIQGFRKTKLQGLRDYLLENGYLDQRPALDQQDISNRLNAFVSRMGLSTDEVQTLIDRVLGHWAQTPAGPTPDQGKQT